jgi:hypothetical protein
MITLDDAQLQAQIEVSLERIASYPSTGLNEIAMLMLNTDIRQYQELRKEQGIRFARSL